MKYLITGGSGSFGNAMIERLLKGDATEIRVFSRNEKLQVDTKTKFNDKRLKFITGDVRDYDSIYNALDGVDYVFHAAAMKHIDKCEQFPLEAKRTNIDGSINVILASIEQKVKKVILLSTDKATNATTIYGNTKMFMEMFAKCVDNKDTEIITTRYGNVMGSNGSVVHIFKELARKQKPLTVTNPDMTRFFMSLSQAVDLVLYALENGNHKDLFVYNNKACTIKEIADYFSNDQIIIGSRGIEKTDEALLTVNELNHSELNGNYYRVAEDCIYPTKNGEPVARYIKPMTSDNCERLKDYEINDMIYDSLSKNG